ncbi:MAG: alpha-L-fucosidase [Saprospiraceae bacterium]|nr:alpha-L-fucosidase [Saprospiraceae bacterium]MCB9318295.1 alpha-L-fucosidase [Lewinellaceae bacterium]
MGRTVYWNVLQSVLGLGIVLAMTGCFHGDQEDRQQISVAAGATEEQLLDKSLEVHPAPRQLSWQKLEMTAFLHFGINTFTDQEWGDGTDKPDLFNPSRLDTRQWIRTLKDSGFKLAMLTAKHHDGFCLWPSQFTDYSVKSSPWQDGQGDVMRAFVDACHEFGLKVGVYLSPWDRHEKTYGSDAYNDYFVRQLTELLTNYGPVDEVWFDGANGEGPNGVKQEYDWSRYFSTVRALQPEAVIAIMGPDVRWVGTETGFGRETEWSVIPIAYQSTDTSVSTQNSKGIYRPQINPMDYDLGSREKLIGATELAWYPAEVDVSIRPGWFYHANQDEQVKTAEQLLEIYLTSVGRNAVLLLNVPPDQQGRISPIDSTHLAAFHQSLEEIFRTNQLAGGTITPSTSKKRLETGYLTDGSLTTYWEPDADDASPSISVEWEQPHLFGIMALQEPIQEGQRIEKFILEAYVDDVWQSIAEGTTVGYKRILHFPTIKTQRVRLIFPEYRGPAPRIASWGLYKDLPQVYFEPKGMAFSDNLRITLHTDDPDALVYYTVDGTTPTVKSKRYAGPIEIFGTTEIRTIAVSPSGTKGFVKSQLYNKARYKILLEHAPDIRYTAGGSLILSDGIRGGTQFDNNRWLGFQGEDLEAIIDLGTLGRMDGITLHFLEDLSQKIFPPEYVDIYVGTNLKNWRKIGRLRPESGETSNLPRTVDLSLDRNLENIRFIKVFGKNQTIPKGMQDEGDPAWIFIDEISIR